MRKEAGAIDWVRGHAADFAVVGSMLPAILTGWACRSSKPEALPPTASAPRDLTPTATETPLALKVAPKLVTVPDEARTFQDPQGNVNKLDATWGSLDYSSMKEFMEDYLKEEFQLKDPAINHSQRSGDLNYVVYQSNPWKTASGNEINMQTTQTVKGRLFTENSQEEEEIVITEKAAAGFGDKAKEVDRAKEAIRKYFNLPGGFELARMNIVDVTAGGKAIEFVWNDRGQGHFISLALWVNEQGVLVVGRRVFPESDLYPKRTGFYGVVRTK